MSSALLNTKDQTFVSEVWTPDLQQGERPLASEPISLVEIWVLLDCKLIELEWK